jgi:general secretion pathway protein D
MPRRLLWTIVGLVILSAPAILKADLISVASTNVAVGATFDLPVTVSGSSDLDAFQFDLSYDPNILRLNSILEGSLLPSFGPTYFIPGTIDNTLGVATFTADTLIGTTSGAVGNGSLAILNFEALTGGLSSLSLSNVILLDSNLNDIAFTAQSGQVSVGSAVPEPGSAWLLASAVVLFFLVRRPALQR